ncbi:MAG: LacI family DNA-binding transcriptional regulator [Thiolinea sp.]
MARPTIADLAEAAGVSVSTVDRVLNGRNPVRRKTAERVMEAAEEIGFYAANVIRHRLNAKQSSCKLGFLLLQGERSFYRNLAENLQQVADEQPDIAVKVETVFMEELTPAAVAREIVSLGERVDALGVVAAEHPLISQAIEEVQALGVPCFALVSSLTAGSGVSYIGLDNWKVGRTAGWAFANLCREPGKIATLIGSHRYRCQEMNEVGFRSYFREHTEGFQLLEPLSTVESRYLAAELVYELLEREPDLRGLYVTGGGITGVVAALQELGRAKDIVVVGYELMDSTRAALLDGTLNLIISHPMRKLAESTIHNMLAAVAAQKRHDSVPVASVRLPFDIYTPENL